MCEEYVVAGWFNYLEFLLQESVVVPGANPGEACEWLGDK